MTLSKNNRSSIVGVIPVRYSSDELLSMLNHKEWYSKDVENKCESRKVERLTVRYLIYLLLGEEKKIIYSAEGKPQLADKSYYISISHTKGYVAVVLSKDHEVGIDIECISPKITRLQNRVMSEKELKGISKAKEEIHLLLHWSAKESMFKIINHTDIEFKTQLHIRSFVPEMYKWAQLEGRETRTKENNSFLIDYLVTKDYVLTVIK
ncbi:MAG: 4'-phosphopantetheinyl transferase superfamily protein [Bacteroidales bacterium]|nr:4'-phosphopantetheinyl transferase superfamily protein [Bacteroidales bacterium]